MTAQTRRVLQSDQLQWRRFWFFIGLLLIALVITLSLISLAGGFGVPFSDKVFHALAYATLMGWFLQLYQGFWQRLLLVLLFGSMGVGMEFAQTLTATRSFDYWDMVANSTGIVIAWLLGFTALGKLLLYLEALLRGEWQWLRASYSSGSGSLGSAVAVVNSAVGLSDRRGLLPINRDLARFWLWLGGGLLLLVVLLTSGRLRVALGIDLGGSGFRFLAYALVMGWLVQLTTAWWQKLLLATLLGSVALGGEVLHALLPHAGLNVRYVLAAGVGIGLALLLSFTPLGSLLARLAPHVGMALERRSSTSLS